MTGLKFTVSHRFHSVIYYDLVPTLISAYGLSDNNLIDLPFDSLKNILFETLVDLELTLNKNLKKDI